MIVFSCCYAKYELKHIQQKSLQLYLIGIDELYVLCKNKTKSN